MRAVGRIANGACVLCFISQVFGISISIPPVRRLNIVGHKQLRGHSDQYIVEASSSLDPPFSEDTHFSRPPPGFGAVRPVGPVESGKRTPSSPTVAASRYPKTHFMSPANAPLCQFHLCHPAWTPSPPPDATVMAGALHTQGIERDCNH